MIRLRQNMQGYLQAIFYSTGKNQEGDSPNFDEILLISSSYTPDKIALAFEGYRTVRFAFATISRWS